MSSCFHLLSTENQAYLHFISYHCQLLLPSPFLLITLTSAPLTGNFLLPQREIDKAVTLKVSIIMDY